MVLLVCLFFFSKSACLYVYIYMCKVCVWIFVVVVLGGCEFVCNDNSKFNCIYDVLYIFIYV